VGKELEPFKYMVRSLISVSCV